MSSKKISHRGPLILFSLMLSSLLLASCVTTGPVSDGMADNFMWKLEEEDTTLYLLGSFHLANSETYPLDPEIMGAWEASDTLIVELNIKNTDQQAMISLTMEKGLLPRGESLEDHLDEAFASRLQEICTRNGLPWSMVKNYKPWLLEAALSVLQLEALGFDPTLGIDLYFTDKAQEQKKAVVELETLEEQLGFLSDAPLEAQIYSLQATVEQFEEMGAQLDQLLTAWQSGDVEGFASLFLKELGKPELRELYETLLAGRNRHWASKIEGLIQDGGKYFLVVGAGHFVGEANLIELLEEKGYQLIQQ